MVRERERGLRGGGRGGGVLEKGFEFFICG